MTPVLELFSQIKAFKGSRQVTVPSHYMGTPTYDVSERGFIGYAPSHRDALLEHLEESVADEDGVVLRQFLPRKVLVKRPRRPLKVPIKHLFGGRAGRGGWIGLTSEEMRVAKETDSATGNRCSLKRRSCTSIGPLESRPVLLVEAGRYLLFGAASRQGAGI